ncbi:MAG: GlsB/YeaQ/YmgE family stress response membrane protein [Candidatus Hydrogenedentes bacterium]|nr:GlsB/YeaQ/YmgE family stress response membrane protein [Candidatus Hydrogenedentota bacterium]
MTLPALLLYIVIAAICGAVGKAIAGGARGGLIVSIFLGLIGAILGPWIAHQFKLSEPLLVTIGGHPLGILWAIIGAAVFVALLHVFSRRGRLLGRTR